MSRLKKALFDFYGGFADKRIKKLDKGTTFIVDGRSTSDLGGDRKPFATFCMVFADVVSEREVRVNLSGNIPVGAQVEGRATGRAWTQQELSAGEEDGEEAEEEQWWPMAAVIVCRCPLTRPGDPGKSESRRKEAIGRCLLS